MTDILDTAYRLGAQLRRITAVEHVGACPRCGGRDRFGVNARRGVWHCRGCAKGGDAIALARHVTGMSFPEALAFVGDDRAKAPRRRQEARQQAPAAAPIEVSPDPEKIAQALALWRAATDPRGTVAETYLNSRGLALDADTAGHALRWHPGIGALLALFRNIATGEPQAVSRTFLSPAGEKLSRKFLGPVGGAAIMLDEPTDELTLAEGIETAMTARALGYGPTWACGSAGAIARLPLIPRVKRLHVLVERDRNGASPRAAEECARRWRAAGRAADLILPPPRCGDLNDAIRQDAR